MRQKCYINQTFHYHNFFDFADDSVYCTIHMFKNLTDYASAHVCLQKEKVTDTRPCVSCTITQIYNI